MFPDFEEDPIGWTLLIIGIALVAVAILSSCVSSQPSCYDNPRNMNCLSATELKKELSK